MALEEDENGFVLEVFGVPVLQNVVDGQEKAPTRSNETALAEVVVSCVKTSGSMVVASKTPRTNIVGNNVGIIENIKFYLLAKLICFTRLDG